MRQVHPTIDGGSHFIKWNAAELPSPHLLLMAVLLRNRSKNQFMLISGVKILYEQISMSHFECKRKNMASEEKT